MGKLSTVEREILTLILGSFPRFTGTGLSQMGQIGTLIESLASSLLLEDNLSKHTGHPCLDPVNLGNDGPVTWSGLDYKKCFVNKISFNSAVKKPTYQKIFLQLTQV